MGKKLTKEEIENRLPDYTIIGKLKNVGEKVLVKHNNCGYEWEVKLQTMLRTKRPTRCPQCSTNLLTKEKVKRFLDSLGYTANLNDFKKLTCQNTLTLTCSHGHTWKTKLTNILYNKTRCPECNTISRRMNPEVAHEKFSKELGKDYVILSKYVNSKTKLKILHKKCGHTYETTTMSILRGRRCPYCFGDKLKTTEEFKKEVKDICGSEYEVLGEYTGKDKPILMKHNIPECGRTFSMRPNLFLSNGCRCPHHSSKPQNELFDFIKNITTQEVIYNEKKVIAPKEIDIFIKDKNLGIEFDGLYWHSEDVVGRQYQREKLDLCKQKNIRLITIFEDEWENKKEIVKSKLSHIIGENISSEKIYARKCIIKEISTKEKNKFLETNHIQGKDNSNIKLGLFFENRLVSVMTFAKSREGIGHNNGKANYYELSRFANDINFHVIGSFGKLLKYFETNYNPKNLISYADLRWSDEDSNIYIKNNFKLKCKNKPNYWYFVHKDRFHRFSFRKTMIKTRFPKVYDSKLTEFQMMDKTQYRRIWDCGTLTYEKEY